MVVARQFGRKKRQGTQCIQSETQQDPGLIRIFPDKHGCRKSHREITSVEGHLYQGTVGHTHPEYLRESLDHRIGDVVGKSPQGKTCGYQDKRSQVADSVFAYDRFFHE